jgi:dimethylargininase
MLTAITRAVSPAIARCELTFLDRRPISLAKAQEQHRRYEQLLEKLGARVISLPAEPDLPDSMFVEDTALVLDEVAVLLFPATESRRGELASVAKALAPFRKLEHIEPPATIEGGDILRIGERLFAGLSSRTNEAGVRRLSALLAPYGYEVFPVRVTGCLHLKSAVTCIGRNTLLANRAWFDAAPFGGYEWIDVDPQEPHAANALAIGEAVLFPASFPKTRARLEARGFRIEALDISELQKAEAGLTCSSLLFEALAG